MSNREPLVVSANIYEYKLDDPNSKRRAALLVVTYRDEDAKFAMVIIDDKICMVKFQEYSAHAGSTLSMGVIGEGIAFLKEEGFYHQIYKNSNTMDISTAEGTEKLMDVIRIGTTHADTVLEALKVVRYKAYNPEPQVVEAPQYKAWGEWA